MNTISSNILSQPFDNQREKILSKKGINPDQFRKDVKRLQALRQLNGKPITIEEIAESIGIKQGTLSMYLGDRDVSEIIYRKFYEKYGDEIKKGTTNDLKDFLGTKEKSPTTIPFYENPIAASHVQVFNDHSNTPTRYITVPGFEDCNFSKIVYGHSMYPTYENGCIVACKEIKDRTQIRWGEAYYVVWGEYEMLKRLRKGDKPDLVLLCSDNDEQTKDGGRKYEPIQVKSKEITRLYLVRLALKPIA